MRCVDSHSPWSDVEGTIGSMVHEDVWFRPLQVQHGRGGRLALVQLNRVKQNNVSFIIPVWDGQLKPRPQTLPLHTSILTLQVGQS